MITGVDSQGVWKAAPGAVSSSASAVLPVVCADLEGVPARPEPLDRFAAAVSSPGTPQTACTVPTANGLQTEGARQAELAAARAVAAQVTARSFGQVAGAVASTLLATPQAAPLRLVAMGDSLTAGTQDANTIEARQHHVYVEQVAKAAGFEYNGAYLKEPGLPFTVFGKDGFELSRFQQTKDRLVRALAPLALYTRYIGILPFLPPVWGILGMGGRTDASLDSRTHHQTNFAVPSFEMRDLHETRGVRDYLQEVHKGAEGVEALATTIPWARELLQNGGSFSRGTQLEQAIRANPDVVVMWAGANDTLGAMSAGHIDDRALTPLEDRPWTVRETDLITGRDVTRTTHEAITGLRTSVHTIVSGLLSKTTAEVMLLNVPDVTKVPMLRTLGQAVGPLPFRVHLQDGTDVTEVIEKWVVPTAKQGGGNFAEGSKINFLTVLQKFLSVARDIKTAPGSSSAEAFADRLALLSRSQGFAEDDVLDTTELAAMAARVADINALLTSEAAANPRIHLVDIKSLLDEAGTSGHLLQGSGAPVVVTTGFTGTPDGLGHDGMFSYDGLHPSDVGHAVIANAVLDKMKADLGQNPRFANVLNATPVDERAAYRQDPHLTESSRVIVLDQQHLDDLKASLHL